MEALALVPEITKEARSPPGSVVQHRSEIPHVTKWNIQGAFAFSLISRPLASSATHFLLLLLIVRCLTLGLQTIWCVQGLLQMTAKILQIDHSLKFYSKSFSLKCMQK